MGYHRSLQSDRHFKNIGRLEKWHGGGVGVGRKERKEVMKTNRKGEQQRERLEAGWRNWREKQDIH